jgi:energy-coupling factor transporter ATP-binding protein EcfA2
MTSKQRNITLGTSAINDEPYGISQRDLRRHLFTIGTTGSGKSTLLEGIAMQLIHQNAGVTFLDPHGDSAERLLAAVPNHRIQDVIYFNAADLDYPIAFNPLAVIDPDKRAIAAENIVGAFKGIWGDSWGARMERIFIIAVQTLLACPGETLLGINRLFTDPDYRARIVQRLSDPMLRDFWEQEFEIWVKQRRDAEYTEPVKNKVGRLAQNPVTRNILGQPRSKLHLDQVVNRGKILIINLSKGAIGEDIANFLG